MPGCMTCHFAGTEWCDMPCACCDCFELYEKNGSLKADTNRDPETNQ